MATVALLALLLGLTLAWPGDLLLRQLHSWQIFHYVLGTKYFDELGYDDFYNGLVLADSEQDRLFIRAGRTRDLRSYYWIGVDEALRQARASGLRQRFSETRWAELKRDLRAIQRLRPPRKWVGPLLDRGFNPSPAWLLLHQPLLNAVPIHDPRVLFFVCNLQLLFYLLTFAVAWWAFGPRTTLLGSLFYLLYFGNWGIITGGYFSRDWFFLTICAAALLRRGQGLAAAPLLAYAAVMRGFPALLALHAVVASARELVQRRPLRYLRFLTALALCCVALAGLSSLGSQQGWRAWLQWKQKISLHAEKHQYTDDVVGLRQLLVHDYRGWNWTPSLRQLERANRPHATIYWVICGLLLLLTVAAMIRREDHDGLLLGLAAVFWSVIVSRYYLSVGVLLFGWRGSAAESRCMSPGQRRLASTWLWIVLGACYLQYLVTGAVPRQTYYLLNAGLALYHLGVLGTFLAGDLKWLRRRGSQQPNTGG